MSRKRIQTVAEIVTVGQCYCDSGVGQLVRLNRHIHVCALPQWTTVLLSLVNPPLSDNNGRLMVPERYFYMCIHMQGSTFSRSMLYRKGETDARSVQPCCNRLLTVSSCLSEYADGSQRTCTWVKNQCEAIMTSKTMNEEQIQNCLSKHSVCTYPSIAIVKLWYSLLR